MTWLGHLVSRIWALHPVSGWMGGYLGQSVWSVGHFVGGWVATQNSNL